jgi:signal recognition particle subunit SRP14
MPRLDHDSFLNELTKMYKSTKEQGSVNVTMKRGREVPEAEENCLMRAYSGNGSKKRKISTVVGVLISHVPFRLLISVRQVSAKDHMRFQVMYGNILKVHLDGLRKRDRAKAKKKKLAAD